MRGAIGKGVLREIYKRYGCMSCGEGITINFLNRAAFLEMMDIPLYDGLVLVFPEIALNAPAAHRLEFTDWVLTYQNFGKTVFVVGGLMMDESMQNLLADARDITPYPDYHSPIPLCIQTKTQLQEAAYLIAVSIGKENRNITLAFGGVSSYKVHEVAHSICRRVKNADPIMRDNEPRRRIAHPIGTGIVIDNLVKKVVEDRGSYILN